MNLPRIDRMKYLAREILPFVDYKRFDMGTWIELVEDDYNYNSYHSVNLKSLHRCGTAACGFGYMTASAKGRRDGLRFDSSGVPTFEGLRNLSAVQEYFDIDEDTALWLFTSSKYTGDGAVYHGTRVVFCGEVESVEDITPAHVAARLETLIGYYA